MIGKQPPNWAERSRIMHRVWGAVDLMVRGVGDIEAWRDICDAINTIEAMVEMGKLPAAEHMPRVTSAIAGMVEARKCMPGRMTIPAEHLQALRMVAQAYDDALERFAARTLGEARTRVVMRIAQQRSAPNGVVVVD
jgi:hypothetical protein